MTDYCLSLTDIIPEIPAGGQWPKSSPFDAPTVTVPSHFFYYPSKPQCLCGSEFGGASRARTDGLVVANDALSQLSYSPMDRND